MKLFLTIALVMICFIANAQCCGNYIPSTSLSATNLSYSFSGGSFQSSGCAPIDPTYWLSGSGNSVTVTFVNPESYPCLRVWGMNDDDTVSVSVNGVSYPLTASSASYDTKVVCGLSPGPNGVIFSGGNLVGANNNTQGNYSYQNLQLNTTNVTSIQVTGISGAGWGFAGVTVNNSLSPAISGNTTICAGQSATLTASGGTTYSWTTGATTSSINISPISTTTYSVLVSSGSCISTALATVVVNPNPTAVAYNNVAITQGQSATLTASGGGTYLWSNGSTSNPIIVSPPATTIYCVTVTNANNCLDTACVTVTVKDELLDCFTSSSTEILFIPNAFSPNGDTENELECILGNCIQTLYFVIYNRWGEKMFETTDPEICWDGTYKGTLQNTAVFVYYLEAVLISGGEVKKKGNVSLIR